MKHSIRELYHVFHGSNSFLATPEYIRVFNIPTDRKAIDAAQSLGAPYALRGLYQQHKGDAVLVHHPHTLGTIYMFGEKIWFDTQEELNDYRAKYHEQRQWNAERNKAKAQLMQYIENHMTTEQILNLLQELEG